MKNSDFPVYVTNETAEGHIGKFTLNVYAAFVLYLIVVANAFGWGAYGLYMLGDKIL